MNDIARLRTEDDILHLTPAGFARIAGYITSQLGIKMPDSKSSMIQSRLVRRVRELGLKSVEQYGDYLMSSGHEEERDHFINAVTTNKTDFFREPSHFTFLTEQVLPSFTQGSAAGSRRVNIWSAACSSGEEPYTLAMVMSEHARLRPPCGFAILATDISTKVLSRARQAIYTAEQVSPVPLELRKRYFLQSIEHGNGIVRVAPELRQKVSFHRLNLIDEDYRVKDRFHVIFLRNVLIYFDREVREAVVNRLCRYLHPGGYLFVGHSESLADLRLPGERVHTSVYRMPG